MSGLLTGERSTTTISSKKNFDATVERISNLDEFLSATRENLDLIILVTEALHRIESILCEMRNLSERATSDNLNTSERSILQKKINNHIAEIDRIAAFTEYKANDIIKHNEDPGNNKLH